MTAFVGAIAFACFSCAAIVAKRREYLYLGGLLSSGLSILLWLQFAASIFGRSTSSFMFEVSEIVYECSVLVLYCCLSGMFLGFVYLKNLYCINGEVKKFVERVSGVLSIC
ncbi:hypothetical protein SETIT_1G155900v2 [Setaria italica]|uniref:Uncharacterized protein n=2 Tax=Setaria TaxID=4554 RepID=A0A368PKN7_SETIT|nr:hypothetical protein SETIT_1G155900v2 [Setaria italica]TKW39103.1 hypothetical protein SEVIR_1G157100v2 [Setaria viridis]